MNARTALLSWVAFGVAVWCGSLITENVVDHIRYHGTIELPHSPRDRWLLLIKVVWLVITALGVTLMMAPWIRKGWLIFGLGWPSHWHEEFAERLNTIGRWTVAGGFVFTILIHGSKAQILLVPALMILSPEFGKLFISGFTGFIDAVFFPGGRESKPPYTLKLARFYVEKERWEEAEAEYERMLSFYPQELEAWEERLRLAFARKDQEGPEPSTVLGKALKAMPQSGRQAAMQACYERQGQ